MNSHAFFARLALLALPAACSSTEPRGSKVELLEQVYGFGPCAREWRPSPPPAQRTVVDIFFAGHAGGSGPTAEQIAKVRLAGGRNIYAFNIPIVRAELDVDAVQRLIGDRAPGNPTHARTVVDTTDRDVELIVRLSRPIADADIAAVERLGARVRARWDFINGYFIEIDDRAVPQVRALPEVSSVNGNAVGCLSGAEVM